MSTVCITGFGHWRSAKGTPFAATGEDLPSVSRKQVLAAPDMSFGRMDAFCRLGLLACSRALQDAGFYSLDGGACRELPEPCGVVAGTVHGCLETDAAYLQTCLSSEGAEGCSPHLFAYTLPSILLGEAALRFGLRGPAMTLQLAAAEATACRAPLVAAVDFLLAGDAACMLAGYCDTGPPREMAPHFHTTQTAPRGAWFVVLEKSPPAAYAACKGRLALSAAGHDTGALLLQNACDDLAFLLEP